MELHLVEGIFKVTILFTPSAVSVNFNVHQRVELYLFFSILDHHGNFGKVDSHASK